METERARNRIWVERKLVLILIHTPFGLRFFDWIANTRPARFYARFNAYLMPFITALAIFLVGMTLVFVFSSAGVRAGERSLGPTANLLIPGLNPYVPVTYGWVALIVGVVIHEAGHGIVARVHNVKVESTGLLLFLGIPVGAFVNIKPEELARAALKHKSAILTAGVLNNMITVAVCLFGLYLIVSTLIPIPVHNAPQTGIAVLSVGDHSLAQSIGLTKGSIIESVAGHKLYQTQDLGNLLKSNLGNRVGITWKDQTGHQITRFASLPKHVDVSKGILGVSIATVADPAQVLQRYKEAFKFGPESMILLAPPTIGGGVAQVPYSDLMAPNYYSSVLGSHFAPVANMLYWLLFINFNLAIFNALPIGPLDGGQLYNGLIENRPTWKTNQAKNAIQLVQYVMVGLVLIMVFGPWFF